MARRRKSYLWVGALSCFLFAATGLGCILTPSNPLTKAFRVSITDNTHSNVITGPFPTRSDFRLLRDHGVRTVVSLLDPNIPYEKVLLQQERKNAAKFGMTFDNFPMASILGQHMGDYYDQNAQRAAALIDSLEQNHAPGKVYLHCYLGLHRMVTVRNLLTKDGTASGMYTAHEVDRSPSQACFDSAVYYYQANNMRGVIREVGLMKHPTVPSLVLAGWAQYRSNHIGLAKQDFESAVSQQPDMYDADNGLGYCYLSMGQLDSARAHFEKVISHDNTEPQAQAGIAMIEYRMGHRSNAIHYLRSSLSFDSTNADAKALLAQIQSAR